MSEAIKQQAAAIAELRARIAEQRVRIDAFINATRS